MSDNWWEKEDEEEFEEEIDLLKCDKCHGLFEVGSGLEPEECPLCGEIFDNREDHRR